MASKRPATEVSEPEEKRPCFPPASAETVESKNQMRKVPVPRNRRTALQTNWAHIFTPIVEQLNLQIRYNLRTQQVEIRTCSKSKSSALQKGADFVRAFMLGFDINDALALVRLEDLYVESFDVKDVKGTLRGDHMGRAVGRLAGKGGKTKFSIENSTKTRIVLADSKVHILGSYHSIQIARRAICDLIMGTPPAKIYGRLTYLHSRAPSRI